MNTFHDDLRPPAARRWLPLVAGAVAVAAMLLGFHSSAQPARGRWTPSADWSRGDPRINAVHLDGSSATSRE